MTSLSGGNRPPYSKQRPLEGVFRRYPLASRAVSLVLGFLLLVPLAQFVRPSDGGRVTTRQLAGAAIGAPAEESVGTTAATPPPTVIVPTLPLVEPVVASVETTPTAPPTAAPAPTAPPAPPPTAAPVTAAKAAPSTTAKPVVTTPKPVATTAKRVATTAKVVATTKAPKPATTAPKPATTAPKPATTAKVVATTTAPKPTTTVPKATTAPSQSWSNDAVVELIRQMWPADSLEKALDVARKESGYRAKVYNGSCCYGVFQIHYGAHKRRLAARGLGLEALYDPRVNIEIALEIFNEQGWSPWTTA